MAADDAASDDASVLTATKPAPAKSPPFNVSSMATPALPTPIIFTAGALAGSSIAAGVWGLVFIIMTSLSIFHQNLFGRSGVSAERRQPPDLEQRMRRSAETPLRGFDKSSFGFRN